MQRPTPKNEEKQMQEGDFIVSKTDTTGKITYGNEIFIQMSGYSEDELLGTPHSILRHPDMPKIVFKLLWDHIQNKKEIFAYVKNLCKDGRYYWVFANVTASLDASGKIVGYYSVRRKPNPKALEVIQGLYSKLLEAEKGGSMERSYRVLEEILAQKGMSYEEFVITIQQL
ncbi:MAG: PAS domain-containing protein [Campylobacterota bacterium]